MLKGNSDTPVFWTVYIHWTTKEAINRATKEGNGINPRLSQLILPINAVKPHSLKNIWGDND